MNFHTFCGCKHHKGDSPIASHEKCFCRMATVYFLFSVEKCLTSFESTVSSSPVGAEEACPIPFPCQSKIHPIYGIPLFYEREREREETRLKSMERNLSFYPSCLDYSVICFPFFFSTFQTSNPLNLYGFFFQIYMMLPTRHLTVSVPEKEY